MTQRPFAPQYAGDGIYCFLATSGTVFAHVEWRPASRQFVLSECETKKPIGRVEPELFNQRVVGYMATL